jgi:F-type H+-transporting ATPase subunit epsilon
MTKTIHVEIASAEAQIFSGNAEMVFAMAALGEVGIAPHHAQMLTTLKPGPIRILLPSGDEEVFYVSSGILEVQPHMVTVLADTALRADDIDEAAALEAKKAAQKSLADHRADFEYSKAIASLAQAVAQLEALKILRKRKKH